jgi:hypothetical protein
MMDSFNSLGFTSYFSNDRLPHISPPSYTAMINMVLTWWKFLFHRRRQRTWGTYGATVKIAWRGLAAVFLTDPASRTIVVNGPLII